MPDLETWQDFGSRGFNANIIVRNEKAVVIKFGSTQQRWCSTYLNSTSSKNITGGLRTPAQAGGDGPVKLSGGVEW
jgi:hypothetical protein